MKELTGTGVALITPFKEDYSVDYETLGKLIDYQIESKVDYLVSLGTTGETATLTAEEKQAIWKFTASHVNKRVPIVAGIGGNNTHEICRQIAEFEHPDYCAILSVSPYYNKPTQNGIYAHYEALAQATSLPLILYNVPGRTGSNIAASTTVELAHEFENIVAIKEASANFQQISEILRDAPEGFSIISGDDPLTLPMMALGAVGVISVVGNAFPRELVALVKACQQANYTGARPLHSSLLKLIELCFEESNPCGVKHMLKQLHIGNDQVRLPLVRISEYTQQKIVKAIEEIKAY